jgi:hypothetical protein
MIEDLKKKSNPEIEFPETKECKGYETLARVEIRMNDLETFLDLVKENKVKVIWSCNSQKCNKYKDSNSELLSHSSLNPYPLVFFFVQDNIIYSAESEGFKNLKDYVKAKDRGFLDYRAFDLLDYISKKYDILSIASIYYDAIRDGYSNLVEFNKSFRFYDNFESFDIYKKEAVKALEHGFKKYDDYYDAKNKRFSKGDEYYEAKSLKIHDYCEYKDYITFDTKMYDYGFDSCFEFHIFHILSRLRGGQTLKLEELEDKLRYESETYSREWYDKSIPEITEKLIEDTLSNNAKFKELGKLTTIEETDPLGLSRTHKVYSLYRNNTIYIDGSNVAWNHGSKRRGDTPYAKNIMIVVEALEKLDFKEILVLCDNNLYDIIKDKDIYRQLSASNRIYVVNKGTIADEWLLKFSEGKDCYIVSDDKYREYRSEYPTITDHIISFQVIGQEAKFNKKINEILDGIVPNNKLPPLCHQSNKKNRF